ncbi:MAG TPA: hypothetical protein VFN09_06350 [Rhodanobacteraceae bacterium]|nr:hypothetical protein [Rhodanobacteraceae bacterium]
MSRFLFALAALALPLPSAAASHQLDQGRVRFTAPDGWTVIMEKTDGDPQFLVFQVPNPQAPGTLSRIGVRLESVAGATGFSDDVKTALRKAKDGQGYKALPAQPGEYATLRYETAAEGVRQSVRLSFIHHGDRAIELSCIRPLEVTASGRWLADWNRACDELAKQLEQTP